MRRRITIPFITLSLLLTPRLGLAQGTLLWQQNINGTQLPHPDIADSVVVDNQGNVLAAGSTWNFRSDFTVAKFAPDGTRLWRQTLNGTATLMTRRCRWRWTPKIEMDPRVST